MKTLLCITLVILSIGAIFAQERVIDRSEFESVYLVNADKFKILNENAHHETMSIEFRAPNRAYKLSYVDENDSSGSKRSIYNEHVEGKSPRLPREMIRIGANWFARNIDGKDKWSVSTIPEKLMKLLRSLPFSPDPDPQAVR